MAIPTFTVLPSINDPTNFNTAMETFVQTELPAFASAANTLAASMQAIAAGGAMSIPYTFSTTTTDSDPGVGFLRLDNATQNNATTIRADLSGTDGNDWTTVLATFDDSTSTVKGQIRLVKISDATKWLIFEVTALATPAGYRNITVNCIGSSGATPFANNDSIVLFFTRNGDQAVAAADVVLYSTATITLSAASVAVPLPTAYNDVVLEIEGMYGNSAQALYLQLNANNGALYDGVGFRRTINSAGTMSSATLARHSFSAGFEIDGDSRLVGTSVDRACNITIELSDINSTGFKRMRSHGWGGVSSAIGVVLTELAGKFRSTAGLTAANLNPVGCLLMGGKIKVWGKKG